MSCKQEVVLDVGSKQSYKQISSLECTKLKLNPEVPCTVKNINTLSHTKAPQANRTFSEIKYAKRYNMRVCVH